jgi:hypothetical protein
MSEERKHPLQLRGRGVPNREPSDFHTVQLIVHKTSGTHCLVSLIVTGGRGRLLKDTRLGECWVPQKDNVGRDHSPFWLIALALEKLRTQPGARLLPEPTDSRA